MTYKPHDYPSVSAYLIVARAAETIRFLEEVFDASLLDSHSNEEGRILHAEIRIEDSVLMLGQASPDWPEQAAHVHIYVPDVDATYARALEHGARSIQAPVQKSDPDKRGGVQDVGGTTWWIATRVG